MALTLSAVQQFNLRSRQKGACFTCGAVQRPSQYSPFSTMFIHQCRGWSELHSRSFYFIDHNLITFCSLIPQSDAFVRMLDLTTGGDGEEVYKVLVLDRPCRDIVSPLIRVNDLRKHGVTLHLLLETERCAGCVSDATRAR